MLEDLKLPQANAAISALQTLAGTRSVEVDLPVLRIKAVVRPVLGSEDLKLKTMKASGATFIKNFNTLLFEHCTFEQVNFIDINDFQAHLSPPDKSMLVYALLDSTFTKLPEKIITCPNCGKADSYEFKPGDMMHPDTLQHVWEEEVEFTEFKIESEIVPGFKVFYSIPSEVDRIQIIEAKSNAALRGSVEDNNDVLSALELFCVYISKIEIQSGDKTIVLEDKILEILPTIKGMPLDLQTQLLEDESVAPLVEYSPKFYLNIKCSNEECTSQDFKWDRINPEQDFFRKALSVHN